jgi:F-type H+-transporting ATPase subunit delta
VIKTAVARRYAKALLGLLDRQAISVSREALLALGDAVRQTPMLIHAMASPAFSAEQKTAVLVALADRLKSPPTLGRFLAQLVKTNRVTFLPEIAEAFAALADQEKGTRHIVVTAARALSSDDQTRVRTRLRELMKQDVDVTFQTNPSLLSGLQISIGSMMYDSSVRSRLTAMRSALAKE